MLLAYKPLLSLVSGVGTSPPWCRGIVHYPGRKPVEDNSHYVNERIVSFALLITTYHATGKHTLLCLDCGMLHTLQGY